MRHLNIGIAICLIFLFPALLLSQGIQTHLIDSLKRVLTTSKEDSNKVNILITLYEKTDRTDTLKRFQYINTAKMLAENLNWQKGKMYTYHFLGDYYNNISDYPKMIFWFQKYLLQAEKLNDVVNQSNALLAIGLAYENIGDYDSSIIYLKRNLVLKPRAEIEFEVLGNLGVVYGKLGDFLNALGCYEGSYKILSQKINASPKSDAYDTATLIGLFNSIAEVYLSMADYNKALINYDKILELNRVLKNKGVDLLGNIGVGKCYQMRRDYVEATRFYEKGLIDAKGINNLSYQSSILNEMGNIELETGHLDNALADALQSLEVTEKNSQTPDADQLPKTYTTLGRIYTQKRDFLKAENYLQKAIAICKKTGAIDKEKEAWMALSNTYEQTNEPARAFAAYKNYIALRDSVYSADKAKELTRTEMQGEFDRQQLQDSLTQAKKDVNARLEIQRQRGLKYAGFAGLALVLLLSFFIYRNYNNEKKANIIIKAEKENAEIQRLRAEHSEQFKQQFLANMSHEIRTPMNAVSGMTDLLLDKGPRPDQQNYLQVISKSSDILLHIINDILDLSKIEAGKLELEQIDFSLVDTIQQVKDTLSIKSEEKGLQLSSHIDTNVANVLLGDPYRLNQVLMNLGGNAIKFTDRGCVEINIKKIAEDDAHVSLQFAVLDTGTGIAEDKLNKLFGNFNQVNTSDSRKYGGTGLGLSISKQLVELMGGNISVESKPGSGTTFSFVISFPKGSEQRLRNRILSEQKADGSALKGLRILIADDNEYNRLVAYEALHSKADVTIDEALNGREAIEMLKQKDYDVILMDVQMPVMNGWDATRAIRDTLPFPKNQTPVIALTASMLRNDLDKCTQAGMNTYVPKPFKTWQLITAIADVTGRKATNISNSLPADKTVNASSPPTPSGITDLNYLYKFCEGEEERMKKYILLYLKAVPAFKEKIQTAAENTDMEEMALQLHSFKPKWMMMGIKNTTELAGKMEQLCKEKNIAAFLQLPALIEQTDQSVEELKDKC